MQTYTVYVEFPDGIEELDVTALNSAEARHKAEAELSAHYLPGGRIVLITYARTIITGIR